MQCQRVLTQPPLDDLGAYVRTGGGDALAAARALPRDIVIDEIEASGLRGRGGAGFPTGRKWRTVLENRSSWEYTSVVVNGAEGEPGTLKDRSIIAANPYQVLEGALIAAYAVDADEVVLATKHSFRRTLSRLEAALSEIDAAGWSRDVQVTVCEGPDEYLYGEETALLEVIDGRPPFPRIAPPFRRGVREVVTGRHDTDAGTTSAAHVALASPSERSVAPPTLVNNVETLANIPHIVRNGARWFRELGTNESPGTAVCTVTGDTRRHAVGETPLGISLREVIDNVGGGPRPGRRIVAVLPGVATRVIPGALLGTPFSYEDLAAIGSGLGSAGLLVFDDASDLAAVAAGVSRFLAIESCGQCTPCKHDGLAIAHLLARLVQNDTVGSDLAAIRRRLATITDGARCYLATQHQLVIASLVEQFASIFEEHEAGLRERSTPQRVSELLDIRDGRATWDQQHDQKQPDWTYDATDSGATPAERLCGQIVGASQL